MRGDVAARCERWNAAHAADVDDDAPGCHDENADLVESHRPTRTP
jgi:hypothetical protein